MAQGGKNSLGDGALGADILSASPQIFTNPVLDKLSRVHWTVPVYVYLPIISALLYLSRQSFRELEVFATVGLGYFIWTIIEYFGHRFLFHYEFPGRIGARIHFLIHGVHHVHPNDPLRLVMPVLLSGPIMLIALLVVRLLFGLPLGYPVLAGFLSGYLTYDLVHYYLHHGEPHTRFGRFMRRAHMLHHFRDPTRNFGVSAPWWDYVFKTVYEGPERSL